MFWESEAKLQTLQKLSPYIWISYKLVLKSLKSPNRIFWKIEYWFKALECQIWSMNTKPFFWESEAKLQTLQKFSPYIGVFFKFVLNSVKHLNRISFWAVEYWSKTLECHFDRRIQKHFSGKARQTLELFKKFLLILEWPINLSWSVPKIEIEPSERLNIGSRL